MNDAERKKRIEELKKRLEQLNKNIDFMRFRRRPEWEIKQELRKQILERARIQSQIIKIDPTYLQTLLKKRGFKPSNRKYPKTPAKYQYNPSAGKGGRPPVKRVLQWPLGKKKKKKKVGYALVNYFAQKRPPGARVPSRGIRVPRR